jgi:hypothetical protein
MTNSPSSYGLIAESPQMRIFLGSGGPKNPRYAFDPVVIRAERRFIVGVLSVIRLLTSVWDNGVNCANAERTHLSFLFINYPRLRCTVAPAA